MEELFAYSLLYSIGYEKYDEYREGIIELVYIVLQSVVKPGITGFFKIDLHIKCYIYLSWFDRNLPRDSLFGFVWK